MLYFILMKNIEEMSIEVDVFLSFLDVYSHDYTKTKINLDDDLEKH